MLSPRPRDLLWKERTRGRFFNLTAERMSARRPMPMNLSSWIWRNLQARLVPPWLFWRFALCRHVPKPSRGNFQKGMSRNKLELQWNSLRTFSRVKKGMISEWGKRNTMLCNKKLFLIYVDGMPGLLAPSVLVDLFVSSLLGWISTESLTSELPRRMLERWCVTDCPENHPPSLSLL